MNQAALKKKQKSINQFIHKRREAMGVTQEALADLVGCTRHTIMRFEKENAAIGTDLLIAICHHLNMELTVSWHG